MVVTDWTGPLKIEKANNNLKTCNFLEKFQK
jgi:hypothetical protein